MTVMTTTMTTSRSVASMCQSFPVVVSVQHDRLLSRFEIGLFCSFQACIVTPLELDE